MINQKKEKVRNGFHLMNLREKEQTCDYCDWRGTEPEANEVFQLWRKKLPHRLAPEPCEADRAFLRCG